ncbi:hypothetical protein PTKIN_Ptkin15bG0069100 [Pterospermum kingtungense]
MASDREQATKEESSHHNMQKKRSCDSLDLESANVPAYQDVKWTMILHLAFQSMGIVYGDLGTSPLYVLSSTFSEGVKDRDDLLAVYSLIFYTLTLLPLIKYTLIVLHATDNGDGGTFALYSLICRYAKVSLIPSQQAEDHDVSNFKIELPSRRLKWASALKSMLEKSQFAKYFLLLATMLGTCMLIGDGILTPSIVVLSAVGGIKQATSAMTEDMVVWLSVVILIFLFMIQRFGTDKVGYTFAPIMCVWFMFIGGIGFYNFIKFDPLILKAINPQHIIAYFSRNKKDAWISLGGVILCVTGAEALFADVGHFTVLSVQISTCTIVYPAILLAYTGQAAFLHKHPQHATDAFYKSVPGPLYWPMFVVAVFASIIASQSLISGTFSIIQQSLSLGCFPPVKVIRTSAKYQGQVYIPEINYFLMLACVGVTAGFRTTEKIGNAYGVAVVSVMVLTSTLMVLIMIMIWKSNIVFVLSYVLVIGLLELVYLSSVLYKFENGGYLPLVLAAILMIVMYVWNSVHRKRYYYELQHKISAAKLQMITTDTNLRRIPGVALFYSEVVQGIPPIFKHYISNIPALHSVLVFVSIKSMLVSKVSLEERFLFRRLEPKDRYMFRCVIRYGYKDVQDKQEPIEKQLVEKLKEFIAQDFLSSQPQTAYNEGMEDQGLQSEIEDEKKAHEALVQEGVGREIQVVDRASEAGIFHLFGENEVIAGKGASIANKVLIDYIYNFLKKNLRQSHKVFDIPQERMLKIGMTYEL